MIAKHQRLRWIIRLIVLILLHPMFLGLWLWPLVQNNVFCAICPSMQPNLILIVKRWVWGAIYGILFWVTLALFALLMGRWWCGWGCPNGLIQEALNKLRIPKIEVRNLDLSPIKWGFLLGWIVTGFLPEWGHLACITCQFSYKWAWLWYLTSENPAYLCFYGQWFTYLYAFTLVFYGVALLLVGRTWCRTFCFVGQSTGLIHWIGVKLKIAKHIVRDIKLCKKCMTCTKVCLTGAITILGEDIVQRSHDCVMCQRCINACPAGALRFSR